MPYPQRPPIPNPYQLAGQAAQQLGGQVQQYGKDQDELAARFRLMMEKRAAAELQKQQFTADQELKQADEKRKQTEFETKQKTEEARNRFLQDFTGADPADPANQIKLKQALTSGVIDAATYKALQPKDPDRFSANGGYYQMGDDGKPVTIIAPKPVAGPAEPSWQVLDRPDGVYQVNPKTGELRKLDGITGKPTVPGQNQFTAAGYGRRIEQAIADIENNSVNFDPTSFTAGASRALSPEWMKSEGAKLQDQAERNFVNAVLRRESGAAISPTEFDSAIKQYFDRPLDPPAVREQKARSRKQALESLRAEAGTAWDQVKPVGFPLVQPKATAGPYSDPGKEARYQEWLKANGGKR